MLPNKDEEKELFKISSERRNFEIELFWKRSLFFWGFIASAFAGFIAVKEKYPDYATLLAAFGLVCSVCWTLVNRGSKRWQENWEQNEKKYGGDNIRELLENPTPIQNEKGWLLRAEPYSPSKLTIALSDFTCVFWELLLLIELFQIKETYLRYLYGIPIIIVIILIFTCTKTSPKKEKEKSNVKQ